MEKISFMRRLSSSLIDKVLILVLFIISALCISPYGMTITDFTLHFSCCFTKLLHSLFITLLNNFTM